MFYIYLRRSNKMQEKDTVISLKLPKHIVEAVKARAEEYDLSMTAYIKLLLINHIKNGENINE